VIRTQWCFRHQQDLALKFLQEFHVWWIGLLDAADLTEEEEM
jgi:hypothetical protein